ncbi:MAG: ATP synthase F1 subunit delta [Ignavibacteriae bacterium]|nr:ATP synthase F1 subunit delta [Ignavibacteriota bacterium]
MLSKAIHRYSLALFQAAENDKKLSKVAVDSNNLIGLIKSSKDLHLFFVSPVIKQEKKIKIVETLFKKKISQLSFEFIKLLIVHNREGLIVDILEGFLDLKNDSEGIIKATVISAIKFDDMEKKKMKEKIDGFTDKNSIPDFSEDNSLIGGFTIQVKDTVIDASIKRQLDNLRNKFKDIIIN